ncbi:MAG: hypothetical protein ACYDBQ_12835 [Thermoplasmatota archaeon]
MTPFWVIGLVANATIAVAFLAVAVVLLVSAIKTKHVRNNPLGVATVLLYIGCGGGHLVHTLQLLDVPLGIGSAAGYAIQAEYDTNWHMWVVDILTAVAGVSYWMMRRRFPALVSGAAVFEDLRSRQRRALEINDTVVQGLASAKLALELGMQKEGGEAVDQTLLKARAIITDLLGKDELKAGALRRQRAGGEAHDL